MNHSCAVIYASHINFSLLSQRYTILFFFTLLVLHLHLSSLRCFIAAVTCFFYSTDRCRLTH
jgi:hypothetical protein